MKGDLRAVTFRRDSGQMTGATGWRLNLVSGVRVPISVGLFSGEGEGPTKVGTLTP